MLELSIDTILGGLRSRSSAQESPRVELTAGDKVKVTVRLLDYRGRPILYPGTFDGMTLEIRDPADTETTVGRVTGFSATQKDGHPVYEGVLDLSAVDQERTRRDVLMDVKLTGPSEEWSAVSNHRALMNRSLTG